MESTGNRESVQYSSPNCEVNHASLVWIEDGVARLVITSQQFEGDNKTKYFVIVFKPTEANFNMDVLLQGVLKIIPRVVKLSRLVGRVILYVTMYLGFHDLLFQMYYKREENKGATIFSTSIWYYAISVFYQ